VLIDGETMTEVPAAKRELAMVFQSYALYPHMSVRKNLSFGLETRWNLASTAASSTFSASTRPSSATPDRHLRACLPPLQAADLRP
jgi:ABC-type sugar transport system ATPase subunit